MKTTLRFLKYTVGWAVLGGVLGFCTIGAAWGITCFAFMEYTEFPGVLTRSFALLLFSAGLFGGTLRWLHYEATSRSTK